MRSVKTAAVIVGLAAAVLTPRVFSLGDFQAADEKRWLSNTVGFTTNLAHGDWGHLMLQPHPGITTQWFAAPAIFSDSWHIRKLPLVIAQSMLIGFIGYVFFRLADKHVAIILTLLMALNPLLIAHTRVLAMDSLLALFLILTLGLLLLFNKTNSTRYLIFSALTASAAVLSKLPGIVIIPFALGLLAYSQAQAGNWKLKPYAVWLLAFLVGLALILPSIAINPAGVTEDIAQFFKSENYQGEHPAGAWYYVRSLVFFSTPYQLLILAILPITLWYRKVSPTARKMIIIFLVFATLFTLQMSLGAKKGDRYILPTFLALDIIAAYFIAAVLLFSPRGKSQHILLAIFALLLILQAIDLYKLHPHTLAYVNPVAKPFFQERRHGWGEGLNLAAAYLNAKPDAADLTVASYYPAEFGANFSGEAIPLHRHQESGVSYAVLYRAMFERGPTAWETDVLQQYQNQTPEHIVSFNGIPFVWIYPR